MSAEDKPARQFVAAKAVLINDGKILFLRESGSYVDGSQRGKYDVPGGRLNPGEDWLAGLRREVFEETGLTVGAATPFWVNNWTVPRGNEDWHVHAVLFVVQVDNKNVILSSDHDHYVWVDPSEVAHHIPLLPGYDQMIDSLLACYPNIFPVSLKGAA